MTTSSKVIKEYMIEMDKEIRRIEFDLSRFSISRKEKEVKKKNPEPDSCSDISQPESVPQEKLSEETLDERYAFETEEELHRQRLREQFYSEGYTLGKTEGFKEGEQVGIERGKQTATEYYQEQILSIQSEGKALLEKAQNLITLAEKSLNHEYLKSEENILNFVFKLSETILQSVLPFNKEHLVVLIRDLIQIPPKLEGCYLHVSPLDWEWLRDFPFQDQFSLAQLEQKLGVKINQDSSVLQGDCFLESPQGIYEASLTSQLEELRNSLKEEVKNARLSAPPPKTTEL